RQHNTAVGCFDIKRFPIPTISRQLNNQAAVRSASANASAHATQNNSTIMPCELDSPANVGYRNSTVISLKRKIGAPRREDLVTHTPMRILPKSWTSGRNFAACSFN